MSENLRGQVLTGLQWVAGARIAGQLFTWLSTLVVIRLLSPEDYGLMTLAIIFVSFGRLFSELGLTPAVVQARDLRDDQLRDVFGAVIVLNVAIIALIWALAPTISRFFEESVLADVLRVLSLQFALTGFATLPEALLQRRMAFRGWSLGNLGSTVAGSVATLVFAWFGYGVWSLVWGNLVNFGLRSIVLNLIVRYVPVPRLDVRNVAPMIRFGGTVSATRVLSFAYQHADYFIIGKLLGKEALGLYSVAFHLAQLPMQRVFEVVNRVAFPAFAKLQTDPAGTGRHYLKGVRLLSLAGVPVCWGMASVAPEAIPLILGEQWTQATLPFQILCLVIPLRMASNLLSPTLQGFGRVDIGFFNMLRTVVVMTVALVVGCQWGVVGVALAWMTAWPAVFLFNLGRSLPVIGLARTDLFRNLARPWVVGGIMLAVVGITRYALKPALGDLSLLAAGIAAGAVSYGLAALAVNRSGAEEALDLVRNRS